MEEKKGTGIFLGIVAVATLIVAIIGATFAYFSISATSNTNAIDLTAFEFNSALTVTRIYPTDADLAGSSGLIPLAPGTTVGSTNNLLYAINSATKRCISTINSVDYQVCALYKVELTNSGAGTVSYDGTLKVVSNSASTSEGRVSPEPFSDLKYYELSGSEPSSFTVPYTTEEFDQAVLIPSAVDATEDIGTFSNVTAGATATKYFVVYLDDTDDEDQSAQMGASFEGQLIFTSNQGAGDKLTGTFTVSP